MYSVPCFASRLLKKLFPACLTLSSMTFSPVSLTITLPAFNPQTLATPVPTTPPRAFVIGAIAPFIEPVIKSYPKSFNL